jgi:hypothetical protein
MNTTTETITRTTIMKIPANPVIPGATFHQDLISVHIDLASSSLPLFASPFIDLPSILRQQASKSSQNPYKRSWHVDRWQVWLQ